MIHSPVYRELHNANYSVISNPHNSQFQNFTEFVLDVIVASVYKTKDVAQIKANEKAYFKPHPVNISPLKLFLGEILKEDITTLDHPGKPKTATFISIGNFMRQYGLSDEIIQVAR